MNAETWNTRHPIGTAVRFYPVRGRDEHEVTKTRSVAWTLGHGDAVVAVEGRSGGVAIDHIIVEADHDGTPWSRADRSRKGDKA